jgi:hypothetical protein
MKKLIYSIILFLTGGVVIVTLLEFSSSYVASENINVLAPVKTKKSIIIHATPQKVWEIMSQVPRWDVWQKDIKNPKMEGTFQKGSYFTWESGGLNIKSTVHCAIPYEKIGWSGPAFGSFAIHNWSFKVLPDGSTKVNVEESMEGWLVQLLSSKFQTGLDVSLDKWLAALKVTAENK